MIIVAFLSWAELCFCLFLFVLPFLEDLLIIENRMGPCFGCLILFFGIWPCIHYFLFLIGMRFLLFAVYSLDRIFDG